MPCSGGRLSLPRKLLDEIYAAARQGLPNEVCGLMAGAGHTVSKLYHIANTSPSPVSYALEPREQIQAMRAMREAGLKMVGIFHSHPVSPAMPSGTDIALALFPGSEEPSYPGAAYLIVSLARGADQPEAAAFLLGKDSAERLELCIFEG